MGKATRLALAGMMVIAVGYGFARYGFGLFVPLFREEFGLSTRAVGLISSAGYGAYFLAMAFTAFLIERFGPRVPVVTGALCASVGMFLIATAQARMQLVLGVVLAGSSPGFCWAPFSDAVATLVDKTLHNRVLSIISSGTSFGLMVAGPIALVIGLADASSGSTWRYAWATFALVALLIAWWSARLLPGTPYSAALTREGDVWTAARDVKPTGVGWFLCRRSAPLLGQAFAYGFVASFYFTYAVDLVTQSGQGALWGPALWTLVGVAGLTGVLAGDAVSRFGLIRCLVVCECILALSIFALSLVGNGRYLVAVCALLFGASYMPISAFLVLWSGNVFFKRPSTGFSSVLFALAFGSIAGPTLLGLVAQAVGLQAAFWCAAVLAAMSVILKPHSDIQRTGDAGDGVSNARTDPSEAVG